MTRISQQNQDPTPRSKDKAAQQPLRNKDKAVHLPARTKANPAPATWIRGTLIKGNPQGNQLPGMPEITYQRSGQTMF